MKSSPDQTMQSLRARYFDVAARENYPHTPKLTQEADNLEAAIRELSSKSLDGKQAL